MKQVQPGPDRQASSPPSYADWKWVAGRRGRRRASCCNTSARFFEPGIEHRAERSGRSDRRASIEKAAEAYGNEAEDAGIESRGLIRAPDPRWCHGTKSSLTGLSLPPERLFSKRTRPDPHAMTSTAIENPRAFPSCPWDDRATSRASTRMALVRHRPVPVAGARSWSHWDLIVDERSRRELESALQRERCLGWLWPLVHPLFLFMRLLLRVRESPEHEVSRTSRKGYEACDRACSCSVGSSPVLNAITPRHIVAWAPT